MPRLRPSAEAVQRYGLIYEYLMEGKSYAEIGKIFGITKQRVQQIVQNFATAQQYAEIRERIDKRSMTTHRGREILTQLDSGRTCYEISKDLNCSVSVVKRLEAKRKKLLTEQVAS